LATAHVQWKLLACQEHLKGLMQGLKETVALDKTESEVEEAIYKDLVKDDPKREPVVTAIREPVLTAIREPVLSTAREPVLTDKKRRRKRKQD
jgi:hypothetical protein